MTDKPKVCGENDCVLYYGADDRHIHAPAGTPFKPGIVIGKFTDDPTPLPVSDTGTLAVIGLLLVSVAAFSAYRLFKSLTTSGRSSRSP